MTRIETLGDESGLPYRPQTATSTNTNLYLTTALMLSCAHARSGETGDYAGKSWAPKKRLAQSVD